jgi:hypothetical protein
MATVLTKLACAAVATLVAGAALAQSVGDRISVGAIELQDLPAQTLSAGRCGLFIWSKTERPVFILFATESPARALVRIGNRELRLDRKQTSGEAVLGHYEKQTFAGGKHSFEIDLTFDREAQLTDGAVIQRGVLRTRDQKGFETILPVGGMIGCKAS